MKLPVSIKHALIEAMISQYVENYPASRISEDPLTFSVPVSKILEDANDFLIDEADVLTTISENPGSLSYEENSGNLQFIQPFTRNRELYTECLDYIRENTSSNPKFTIEYDSSIKESLIYHFFAGSIVLMVPDGMNSLSQLKFALMAGGSKLRSIIDTTGGWIYVFPKYIMESMECGKMLARDTNVQQVLASYLEDIFPDGN